MTAGTFSGGEGQITVTNSIKKSDTGSGGWSNATSGLTYELKAADDGKFFRATSKATDEAEQSMNNNSPVVGPVTTPIVYDPLVVGDPVATGDAFVGYTLTCSEPSVDGGSGDVQIDYYWVDAATKAIVWEAQYMSNTTTIIDYDLGKTMYCMVIVTDQVTGDSITKESNHKGPINRPVIPEYEVYVNSELYDDPSQQIGVLPNGSVVCEVRPETVSNPPLDLTYEWKIRTGTGRLSGDETATGIIYMAPDAAPAGAALNCTVSSRDAADNAFAAEITILVSEEETQP